jgi:hypothetical protein
VRVFERNNIKTVCMRDGLTQKHANAAYIFSNGLYANAAYILSPDVHVSWCTSSDAHQKGTKNCVRWLYQKIMFDDSTNTWCTMIRMLTTLSFVSTCYIALTKGSSTPGRNKYSVRVSYGGVTGKPPITASPTFLSQVLLQAATGLRS